METKKKTYIAPETEVTHVEIESSICGGSVDFEAKPGVTAKEQVVNDEFAKDNDFSTSTWDKN